MPLQTNRLPLAHIRFEGHSFDVPLAEIDLDGASGDLEVKRAVARYLDVPVARLLDYVVDRHETGNLTVRPQAVFG